MEQLTRKKTLAECAVELELLCREADDKDGILSDAEMDRLDSTKGDLCARVDNWIMYLDATKAIVSTLEERKDRAGKALKTAENVQKRLRNYLKFLLEQFPTLPWKGEEGSLYLHANAKKLWVLGEEVEPKIKSVSVANVVPGELAETEPSMRPYLRQVTFTVLDKDLLKGDLESGMEFPWAKFERGAHVRVK